MLRCSAAAASPAPFREREEALLRSLFRPHCFCPPVRVFGPANAGKTRTVLSALRATGCSLVAFIDCLQLHSERQLAQSIACQWSCSATRPAAPGSSAAAAVACASLADLPAVITATPELHRQTAFIVLKEPQVSWRRADAAAAQRSRAHSRRAVVCCAALCASVAVLCSARGRGVQLAVARRCVRPSPHRCLHLARRSGGRGRGEGGRGRSGSDRRALPLLCPLHCTAAVGHHRAEPSDERCSATQPPLAPEAAAADCGCAASLLSVAASSSHPLLPPALLSRLVSDLVHAFHTATRSDRRSGSGSASALLPSLSAELLLLQGSALPASAGGGAAASRRPATGSESQQRRQSRRRGSSGGAALPAAAAQGRVRAQHQGGGTAPQPPRLPGAVRLLSHASLCALWRSPLGS